MADGSGTVLADAGSGAAAGSVAGPYGAAIGGALGLVGGIMSNQASQANVSQQENFQSDMSGTAYQRQVKDMEAAGLNPMFVTGSGGSSTPMGSVAVNNNVATPMLAGASQGLQLVNSQRQTDADILNKSSDTLKNAALIRQSNAQTGNLNASTGLTNQQTKNAALDAQEKDAVATLARAVKAVMEKSGQGWQQLFNLVNPPSQVQKPVPLPQQ